MKFADGLDSGEYPRKFNSFEIKFLRGSRIAGINPIGSYDTVGGKVSCMRGDLFEFN